MDTREKIISLIENTPVEKLQPVFELVADELNASSASDSSIKKNNIGSRIEKSGYILFEYNNDTDTVITKGDKLRLDFKGRSVDVLINDETIILKSYLLAGEQIYVIGKIGDEACTAKVVASRDFYDMFSAFESLEAKNEAVRRYSNLPPDVQENIKNELSGKVNPSANNYKSGMLTRIEDLKFKFDICRHAYTPQQQVDIEGMFEDCKKGTSSNAKERALRRLTYFLNINQSTCEEINFTKSELVDEVKQYIYGQDKAVEKMAEAIISRKYSSTKGCVILLVGPPGTGKSALPKAFAKVLGLPFFKLPMSTLSYVGAVGTDPQYDASDSGEFIKCNYKSGSTYNFMLLDEYDKSYESSKEGGKTSQVFNDCLSDESTFKDNFLGTYISTANTIFVLTANSTEGISEHLLNRMTVVNIREYQTEEKIEIARNYILPDVLSTFNIKDFNVTISDENVQYIIENFCVDDGVRDVKKHLVSIVNHVVATLDEEGSFHEVEITREIVDKVLTQYVDADNPEIIFRRNKQLYSPKVADEIKATIAKLHREDIDGDVRVKAKKKLEYLVYSIPLGDAFADFDRADFFNKINTTHFGQEKAKTEIAQTLNISAVKGQPITNNKFLLVGGYGIGKSSIAKSVADACNAGYYKVSLNGVSDEATVKGHTESYVGADAGLIIKAIRSLKSTKGVLHLDEVDKLGNHNGVPVSNTLVDLLDDSAEFTDNFLGVPVDLSNVLFIATCNNINAVDPVIRDRFTVIYLDGYTKNEKGQIIEYYLIPKLIKELCPDTLKMSVTPEAITLLKSSYCLSFGVRDAEKTVRKLVKDKLYTLENEHSVKISENDVQRILGNPPAKRGNFPEVIYPGLSKGLAVTGDNVGMAFAIETALIPNDNSITTTGLPKESTIDSVKLAITFIKIHYPGLLDNKGIHVHFAEGAVQKDGPSAGVAIMMSILSAGLNETIKENVAYTGEINSNGYVFNIGGTKEKIQGAQESGCTTVFIPEGNYKELSKEDLILFSVEIVPVKHISQVIERVFPELNQKIA